MKLFDWFRNKQENYQNVRAQEEQARHELYPAESIQVNKLLYNTDDPEEDQYYTDENLGW